MKLYYSPGACSLAPHIVLREIGLPFELMRVDNTTHKAADGSNFYDVNSKGYVPVLELDNGERLTEGPIIAQYLSDLAGREDLMPAAGTIARYRVLEWQNYITSELHKSFSPLFNSAFDTNAKDIHAAALYKKFEWVSSELAGRKYLTGDSFTAADAYLFTVASWAKYVKLDLTKLDNLQHYLQLVATRETVKVAMQAEGLI